MSLNKQASGGAVEQAYIDLGRRLIKEGEWVYNERTGERCLTLIRHDIEIDLKSEEYPLLTSRDSPFYLGIGELVGYLRGYDSAEQFRSVNSRSWDSNANLNKDWLANPNRKGEDDLGPIYGAIARSWPVTKPNGDLLSHTVHDIIESMPDASESEVVAKLAKLVASHKAMSDAGSPYKPARIDLLRKVYDDLRAGKDDRGEILTFWNPGQFHLGALRPCMYEHIFSLLNGNLTLNSTQRSVDVALGLASSNLAQVYLMGKLMGQITGNTPDMAHWTGINVHLYEKHVEQMEEQITRPLLPAPKIWINPEIKTLEDIETWVTPKNDFKLLNYQHGDKINYEFTV
tara:strand:- start:10272 stop:11303 length:1032 start_codon:yes stop_codon:yes gene_type:complete